MAGARKIRLVRREFEAWLREKEPGIVVGDAGEKYSCPLAIYVMDKYGVAWAAVGNTKNLLEYKLPVAGYYHEQRLPGWAQIFVALVDEEGGPPTVTAEQALSLLHEPEVWYA